MSDETETDARDLSDEERSRLQAGAITPEKLVTPEDQDRCRSCGLHSSLLLMDYVMFGWAGCVDCPPVEPMLLNWLRR